METQVNIFATPIEYVRGIGMQRGAVLKSEIGIYTLRDLLNLFPNRYIDKTKYYKVNELNENLSEVQVVGRLGHVQTIKKNGRAERIHALFYDQSGTIELVWFRGLQWVAKKLKEGQDYVVFGKPSAFMGAISIAHPDMEFLADHQRSARMAMYPVYPSSEKLIKAGITSKVISRIILEALQGLNGKFMETLSPALLQKHRMVSKNEAMIHIHFPKDQDSLAKARFRLKYEELFFIQLILVSKKDTRHNKLCGFRFEHVGELFNYFYQNNLTFELTNAQKRVMKEIRADVGRGYQMNRLLQGDVGSGKTIVALMAMLIAIDNGFQTCMMAPTEVLANQHYDSIVKLLEGMPVRVELLTGSTRPYKRKKLFEDLGNGKVDILLGTHALLEDKVEFLNLGFAVVDEQHRFGVAQRARLWGKNSQPPHVLVMTATPIPRTLAMSLYGDLDVSVIDELPAERKSIITGWKNDSHRLSVFKFLKDELDKGRQAYIVYPLIEESETLDYKNLMDGYEAVTAYFQRPEYQVGIVHGKMRVGDKDYEMQRFAKGETNILVATTVIEVGINVPNASVMVIESAERFGLSQLHQLRGRVGRGAEQSYCILMSGYKLSAESRQRLETMVRTTDGFEISEMDLKLRGPGDIMGIQQSGLLNLQIADIVKDNAILAMARIDAQAILDDDPSLCKPENAALKTVREMMSGGRIGWGNIS